MEENKTPAKPVMDVAPPRPPAVHPDPTEEKSDPSAGVPPKPGKPDKSAPKTKRKAGQDKSAGKGVGLAIAATVVIVLGLASMATYAYIKTQ